MTRPIVVATDGSEVSLEAAEWAAREAVVRHAPLRVIHVLEDRPGARHFPGHHPGPRQARSALAAATRRARAAADCPDIAGAAVCGQPARVLTGIGDRASMLVTGMHAYGKPLASLTGLQVAGRARCPVVLVGGPAGTGYGQIIAAADDTAHGTAALGFAFQEAARRGAGLTVVHAWPDSFLRCADRRDAMILFTDPVSRDRARWLSRQLAPWRLMYPAVAVTESPMHANPGRVLAMLSDRADMIVVGAPAPALAAEPLGPVSRYVAAHAHCPVALIPAPCPDTDVAFPAEPTAPRVRIHSYGHRKATVRSG
jgi:nucleotide-binding universal stress UspA family protein